MTQASGGFDGPVVARVRARVRSSIYLIVAEVEKEGSTLLDQVCILPPDVSRDI